MRTTTLLCLSAALLLCLSACGSPAPPVATPAPTAPPPPTSTPALAPTDIPDTFNPHMPDLPDLPATLAAYTESFAPYTYTGDTDATYGERHFALEDTPENAAEGLIVERYAYEIAGAYDKYAALFDSPDMQLSAANLEKNNESGGMNEYIVHTVSTMTRDEVLQSDEYFITGDSTDSVRNFVNTYAYEEFTLVKIDFSMTWSPAALARGPQLGDGDYTRIFLCGREPGADWKIYEIYWV